MISLMAVFSLSAKTLYLAPNDDWKSAGARFAVYAFDNGEEWYSMTAVEGETGLYQAAVDDKYPSVIFCRMNGEAAENNWGNKWNQTQDMTIEADKNLCNISGWDNAGAWAVYTPAGGGEDDQYVYVKVTEEPTSWAGEYLIVCDGESVAFNSSLANNTTDYVGIGGKYSRFAVTIHNDTIDYHDTIAAKHFTITAIADKSTYSIKSASNLYIGRTSTSNGLDKSSTNVYENAISYNATSKCVDIVASSGAYMRYNKASNEQRFRFFKADTYTAQQPIQLYKKVKLEAAEDPGDTPEPKFYVTGNAALVGEELEWHADAVKSEQDTLVLNLEADKQYMMKLTLRGEWKDGEIRGFDALTEKAEGLVRGTDGSDDNIIFSLDEAGQVKVVYIAAANEQPEVFKLIGNFYVAPTLKYYITGGEDIVGEGKATWGKTDALESYKDTLVLNLSEGAHKFKLITPAEQWLGLEALTDTAYGLYTDDDTNICFNLAEPGAVTVIFNATEFKVIGDFYIAPVANYYLIGDSAFVVDAGATADKQWTPDAIPSFKDTMVLNLKANQDYIMRLSLKGAWDGNHRDYRHLTTPVTPGVNEIPEDEFGNHNIGFRLDEAGSVTFIYIPAANEQPEVFKILGNFHVDQVDMKDLEIVADGIWAAEGEKLGVWAWNAIENEGHWFATAVENEKLMAHIPVNYDKVIVARFAAEDELDWTAALAQTADLDFNECAKLYLNNYGVTWCTPAQPEEVVFTVVVPEGTDSVFIAGNFNGWTFEKMDAVEGQENKYTITKNIAKEGAEYKYTAGPDWAYVELPEEAPNRTWAALDEVTAWKAVPQPVVPVDMKDLEIVAEGEWAAEGEKLGVWAWNAIEDEGHWFATAVENEKLMAHIPVNYDKVIVARFAADAELDWNNKLAQTSDLDFNECAKLYLATAGANWCAPVPAFEPHDFFITGTANLVGSEELAWNPNAIPVDGNSKVLHLGAGTYEMKIVLDSCGASNCQQWFGCERLSDEQVEGVACSKVGNIEFALAGEEDVTVTVNLTDTIITLTGNFYNIQMVDIRLVLSPEWAMDNAKFAAVTWRDGQEMENDGVFTDWFVGTGDTVVGQIPEDATQIAFARFAPEVVEPFMNPEDPYFWNHSDKLIIEPSMIYTITGGDVPDRNFSPGYWGEKPDFIADGYFLLGTFNEWTPSAAYEFSTPDNDGQRKVTVALEENDQLKVAEYYRGYRIAWFPDGEDNNYVVDEKHAGSAQDIYFRADYSGDDAWHYGCIYVVDNGATAIDNTAIDAKAEKMLRNGMILIIKGDKTYNVMGQIVK